MVGTPLSPIEIFKQRLGASIFCSSHGMRVLMKVLVEQLRGRIGERSQLHPSRRRQCESCVWQGEVGRVLARARSPSIPTPLPPPPPPPQCLSRRAKFAVARLRRLALPSNLPVS
jgi:hypothetical protein